MKIMGNGINVDLSYDEIRWLWECDPETYSYLANYLRVILLELVDKYPPLEKIDETTKGPRKTIS